MPATLNVPADRAVACGSPTVPSVTGQASASYSCNGAATVAYSDAIEAGPCSSARVIVRTWTATTPCGTVTSGVQRINVVDNLAPTVTAPADVTRECSDNSATGVATATDNCDGAPVVTFSDVTQAGSCSGSFVIVR